MSKNDGLSLAINQVEYANTPDGPVVYIFGRDPSGTAHQIDVTGFQPYFYGPQGKADSLPPHPKTEVDTTAVYTSIRGETLRRIYTRSPGDVRDVRDYYEPHYEADIPFATRYLIDRGLTGGAIVPGTPADYRDIIPAEVDAPARVCMMDIECEDERGFPEPARDAIVCITCHDSFDDAYVTLYRHPPGHEGCVVPVPVRENHQIIIYPSERELLRGLAAYISEKDPDILSGWNFVDFDISYITKRMEAIGLEPDSLSRIPGAGARNPLRGRALFDLLMGYRKMQSSRKESYRLDAIGEEELGEGKIRYTGTLCALWRDNPQDLVAYNLRDVELCVGIDAKSTIIGFYREIARYVGCPLDRTLNSSNVIDIFVLRKAFGKYVLPSKGFAAGDEFEGATVFDPSRGVKENVVVLDLKSLYPMCMMTINASMETKDPEGELHAPNGIRFRKSPDGLTRSIIADLLNERDEKKALRNTFEYGSPDYLLYDIQQNVLKVIMNTYYGVSGYARFRLYDRDIGSAVTSVGRAIIAHTRDVITGMGYCVIYGDTDSCMIELPVADTEKTIAMARAIESRLNESYGDFARNELGAETHYFSIKFEKIYRRFFQAGKKKRYAGQLVWKEGKEVDKIDIVGFEIKRSDSSQVTKEVQQHVMELILRGAGKAAVKSYLGDVIKKYRKGNYSLDEIGTPGGINKALDSYKNKDAHVRGAEYSNKYLGTGFVSGSKPKRVYIRKVTGKYPKTDVVCFEYADQIPPEFVVDIEKMLNRSVEQPISRIIEAVGWSWQEMDPSHTTLSDFF
ncbi:DNA-directed DNA polymerase [Methanogenium marinum]|uniref:DNA polymerase n=1 Tax=Methanogenium marinum TaxID=348610 RepID=A0A9Q4KU81_9EURY|nr:DNA-directed DNA polymerase [Methanogenium marinum]MDE4908956.1 DNA-directed DNA polymerase [Methanogenium marinum]